MPYGTRALLFSELNYQPEEMYMLFKDCHKLIPDIKSEANYMKSL